MHIQPVRRRDRKFHDEVLNTDTIVVFADQIRITTRGRDE